MKAKSAVDVWQAALEDLKVKVSPANYETWLRNTVGLAQKDGCFIVGVPSSFVTESLENRLHPLIEKTVSGIAGRSLKVQFQVHLGNDQGGILPASPVHSAQPYSQRAAPPRFNRRYTFETFLVGSCNRLAHAASQG